MINGFSKLRTLTAMQLKEKLDMSYLRSFKKTLFKVIWLIIEFIALTFICSTVFDYAKQLSIFANLNVPDTVMNFVLCVTLLLSIVFSTVGLVKSLYFSRDNMVLLTFPASPELVFVSKLTVYYIYEFKKNFMFMFPLLIGFSMTKTGYSAAFYPWVFFLFVFISALPILISALLSIPFMFVYQYVKKHTWIQYVLYSVALGAVVFFVYFVISKINGIGNINLLNNWPSQKIESFFKQFAKSTAPIYALTQLVFGDINVNQVEALFAAFTLPYLLVFIASCVVLFGLNFLFAKPLFYKMASKPFEYTKKMNVKEAENNPCGGFLASVRKEFRVRLRSNSLTNLLIVLCAVMPLSIQIINKIYSLMNTRALGTQMTISFNVLFMLLILLATNMDIASAYSKDGSCAYLNKIQPANYEKILFSKLILNLLCGLFGTVFSVSLFGQYYTSLSPAAVFAFGVTVYCTYAAHLFWSAELDLLNPQYEQYATFNEQANNPNENKSAIFGFLLAFIIFAISLFLGLENSETVWLKLAVVTAVLAVGKVFTFFMKIKAFYLEK